ncbi:MAG: endolytic transglycosylase MltG [Pseudomonadota bacterium]
MADQSDTPQSDGPETDGSKTDRQDRAKPGSKRGPFWRLLFFFALLAVGAAAAGAYYIKNEFERPGPLAESQSLVIERGSAVKEIAEDLEVAGIISNPDIFRIGVRVLDMGRDLKAGEFVFEAQMSMRQVAEHLRSGETLLHRVTIPEGLTSQDVVALLAQVPQLEGTIDQIPPEGALLPETYYFSRGDSRQVVLARMAQDMEEAVTALWSQRQEGLPLKSADELVVLASIVERETGVDGERALVAGVFINRLRKGMRLQSDPTVVYGLAEGTGELGRPLTRKDLKTKHAYNTYIIDALPPGPIANPGLDALQAVAEPAETEFFYFVADGSGGHAFAKTLDEHNKNVAAWRKFQKQQKATDQN